MHLRGCEAGAGRVFHRLEHVRHQAADFRRAGVRDRLAHLQKHGMSHARYLQNRHVASALTP